MKAIIGCVSAFLLFMASGCGSNSLPGSHGPVGPFLFVAGHGTGAVFSFTASSSGSISPLASTPAGQSPSAVALQTFDTSDQDLFVTDSLANSLMVLDVNGFSGGQPTPTGISVPVGTDPIAIGLRGPSGTVLANGQPDRGDVYVLNQGSNNISAFRLTDTTGHMTAIPGSPFATPPNPQAIAVLTGGTSLASISIFVFVANGALGTISAFKANPDGSLVAIAGSPFVVGGNVSALASRFGGVILLASDSANNQVLGFKVQDSGTLTPLPGSTVATGVQPGPLMFASNDFVYVLNRGGNSVSGFKFDFATSTLAPVPGSPFPVGTNPVSLGMTRPTQLYVANEGSNDITGLNIDSTTGNLTPMAGSPFHVATAPDAIQTLFIQNVD